MVQIIADRRDVDFNLYEIFNAQELCDHKKFKEFNQKTFNMIVKEARNFAIKEMLAVYKDGDEIGVNFEDGTVKVPDSFHRVHKLFCENEWTAPASNPEFGGQGLPYMVAGAIKEYMMGANWPLYAYASMGVGTGRMIETFGTKGQIETYLNKLYTGKWGGTMLLTESDAGTDLGALTTTAVKNFDGTYSLTGNKIFITNGEHDLCENIIHPVLARIKGDPEGTKGISIFIVPKFLVNPDLSLGERNDILCTGAEEKHGIHGSATCSLALGSKGNCVGYLLGEERKGMNIMFNMMNGARLSTGAQAMAYASTAYLYALDYARNRIQGKDLKDILNPKAPSVPIIHHPDVRRNLLWMKSYVEGLRSLIYYTLNCMDRSGCEIDKKRQEKLDNLIEILTPIIKGYSSERGYEVCIQAMQVFGGAGYIRDCPVEALARDCKITSIYEGCTGVQAMDLLGRKAGMNKGAVFMDFIGEIKSVIEKAKQDENIKDTAQRVETAVNRFHEIASHLGRKTKSLEIDVAFAHATPFMEIMGDICMAWMHLLRANTASYKIAAKPKKRDRDFYTGQLKTAEFFIHTILPVTMGKMDVVADTVSTAIDIPESSFGGL
ncbi:MAG: acyl-CoA dehydrogenase [Deltaproteobacteria bacterium]|nr:acyl-CoA dehydrogenase [Deltaproteobacteria bacterium]